MQDHIAYAADRIRSARDLPALLAAAFAGLELVERAASALADRSPAYATALTEASDAWWALTDAPSLRSLEDAEPGTSVATFSLLVTQALVAATARAVDPADRIACLQAARHAGRVHDALC
ncbi:hypothetical protein ACGFNU_09035 [Spirillospora sp. NPDC048911]|uniref:hypothetical protein n=1 Tax=Spirillospora sp. NPDC048911 TaxID=3364527 RepID=UPI0037203629